MGGNLQQFFTASASAVSIPHGAGNNGNSTVSIAPSPTNGWSSMVNLSATILPSGVTVSLSPSGNVPVPGSSTATATLDSTVGVGTYYIAVTVTGTTSVGTFAQMAVIVLTVT